ncbi:YdeI/OmpD-associated family protein [Paenibacillus hamazuiensis]|uniref:YdeI/OmpD-associated family protein n=1 Tax=Paenibacillus hamazuiensis TaxID=2936508 RepID=UPI00200CAE9C|nr:YdeI/OmpD-associated family protein [Paenibacillus hamazuiensis]
MQPVFFRTPSDFRRWLEEHHGREAELLVGFYKKDTGIPSITWPEAVDEALCFGWIDGVRKRIDDTRYMIRFTPRKPRSIWSSVNISRAEELIRQGLMRPAGLKAFEERLPEKTAVYSFEQKDEIKLADAELERFQAQPAAWEFFQSRPASYRKAAVWWVISAKKAETRDKRLSTLIDDSAHSRTIAHLTRKPKQTEQPETE